MVDNSEIRDESYEKSSLHEISPYVGKLKPSVVSYLINKYSQKNNTIFDPFCGSGTVLLEAWINGRETIGIDLNYYAYILSKAKLFPYASLNLAIQSLNDSALLVNELKKSFIAQNVEKWVSNFFHPETLREITIWMDVLIKKSDYFTISCLLGILHHQRPGFLSYPCSHGVPYLRNKKFPIIEFPELYEYRSVYDKLYNKVIRTYKVFPKLDYSINREVYYDNTLDFKIKSSHDITIITSPPYMKSLTYARDNRLRLWFLGYENWIQLDKTISYNKRDFQFLMDNCFKSWSEIQSKGNYCILVVGDILYDRSLKQSIPDMVSSLAALYDYRVVDVYNYPTDIKRKIVKTESKIATEKICVFQRR
jgi:hypothetical protein